MTTFKFDSNNRLVPSNIDQLNKRLTWAEYESGRHAATKRSLFQRVINWIKGA